MSCATFFVFPVIFISHLNFECLHPFDHSVIEEQIVLRNNAIAQSELLMEYKKLFVRHSSHHYALQHKTHKAKQGEGMNGTGLLSIFTSLLAEPLSKTGTARTASDHHIIELILQLINNLLSITPINTFGSTEKSQYASQLHRELLIVLQEEMVLDVLVCVGQEVERRENHNYNLLLMEILSRMLRGQVRVMTRSYLPPTVWRMIGVNGFPVLLV